MYQMKFKKWEEKITQKDLICRTNKYKYYFQQYKTVRSFGESIYDGKIKITTDDEMVKLLQMKLKRIKAIY